MNEANERKAGHWRIVVPFLLLVGIFAALTVFDAGVAVTPAHLTLLVLVAALVDKRRRPSAVVPLSLLVGFFTALTIFDPRVALVSVPVIWIVLVTALVDRRRRPSAGVTLVSIAGVAATLCTLLGLGGIIASNS